MILLFRFACITLFLTSAAAYVSASQSNDAHELRVVPSVDLERYMGVWYEIARLPNPFQDNCAGDVTATYTLLGENEIRVVNRCRGKDGKVNEVEGRARRASPDGPAARLEVRFAPAFLSFLPFVWGNYWIIDLDSDYRYAVVGEPDREYLWILSRTPDLADDTMQEILERVRAQGYELSGLIRTRQRQ
jgi:apolipoprotein D and lipocalin family protein